MPNFETYPICFSIDHNVNKLVIVIYIACFQYGNISDVFRQQNVTDVGGFLYCNSRASSCDAATVRM